MILPSFAARQWLVTGALVHGPAWFPSQSIELHLLRAPRHRGSRTLDTLSQLLTRALEEAELATLPPGRP